MIGVVGITIFPENAEPSRLWHGAIQKKLKANFPIRFINIQHKFCTIELCVNDKFITEKGCNTIFIGKVHESHIFSLDDHGIEIKIFDDSIIIHNDWLASLPLFYNEKTHVVSTFYNAAIDTLSLDNIGWNAYLRYGYSFYGATPFQNVKFMHPNSCIEMYSNEFKITKRDRFEGNISNLTSKKTTAYEIVEEIRGYLSEKLMPGNKSVLPLSGGLDSRLLAGILKTTNIHAFTYSGNTKNYESVNAEIVAKRLNLPWKRVKLTNFYQLMDQWVDLYGASEHAHGMYHIEFYRQICEGGKYDTLLSGIFADIWAGNNPVDIKSVEDIHKLGYSHGLSLSKRLFSVIDESNGEFHLENDFLKELGEQNLLSFDALNRIQMKIILISYLMTLPRFFGLTTITPFLNKKIAIKMLSLPKEERLNRKWQKDALKDMGLDIKETWNPFKNNYVNNLDLVAYKKSDFTSIKKVMHNKEVECLLGKEGCISFHFNNLGKLSCAEEINMYLNSTRGVNRIMKKMKLNSAKLQNLRDVQVLFPLFYLKDNWDKK